MWLENFSVNTAKCWQTFYGFLQIYHSYHNEKLRVDKLALYASLQELGCICRLVFENTANKVFYIHSEYIKRIINFGGEIYSENCQLFESFHRF